MPFLDTFQTCSNEKNLLRILWIWKWYVLPPGSGILYVSFELKWIIVLQWQSHSSCRRTRVEGSYRGRWQNNENATRAVRNHTLFFSPKSLMSSGDSPSLAHPFPEEKSYEIVMSSCRLKIILLTIIPMWYRLKFVAVFIKKLITWTRFLQLLSTCKAEHLQTSLFIHTRKIRVWASLIWQPGVTAEKGYFWLLVVHGALEKGDIWPCDLKFSSPDLLPKSWNPKLPGFVCGFVVIGMRCTGNVLKLQFSGFTFHLPWQVPKAHHKVTQLGELSWERDILKIGICTRKCTKTFGCHLMVSCSASPLFRTCLKEPWSGLIKYISYKKADRYVIACIVCIDQQSSRLGWQQHQPIRFSLEGTNNKRFCLNHQGKIRVGLRKSRSGRAMVI